MMLMMRLAAEAGLRRAEVARVHTRDVLDGIGGPRLVVRWQGQTSRVVPIGASLAATLRRGAAGHTPGMPGEGWLFPAAGGGHLTPHHVGRIVAGALPDGWTIRTLRYRFATRGYSRSGDLLAVQELRHHLGRDD